MSIKLLRKLLREAADHGWCLTIQAADGSGRTAVSAWRGRHSGFALVDRDPIKALARAAAQAKSTTTQRTKP